MLPITSAPAARYAAATPLTYEYAARMLRWRQMDFEYAMWLMANLCISPRTAFRSTYAPLRVSNKKAQTPVSTGAKTRYKRRAARAHTSAHTTESFCSPASQPLPLAHQAPVGAR